MFNLTAPNAQCDGHRRDNKQDDAESLAELLRGHATTFTDGKFEADVGTATTAAVDNDAADSNAVNVAFELRGGGIDGLAVAKAGTLAVSASATVFALAPGVVAEEFGFALSPGILWIIESAGWAMAGELMGRIKKPG